MPARAMYLFVLFMIPFLIFRVTITLSHSMNCMDFELKTHEPPPMAETLASRSTTHRNLSVSGWRGAKRSEPSTVLRGVARMESQHN